MSFLINDLVCDFDNSFDVLKSSSKRFSGISSLDIPKNSTFCFLKEKKFTSKLDIEKFSTFYSSMCLIVSNKLWNSFEKENTAEKYKNVFESIVLTENVNEIMSRLSKRFHELYFGELNYFVDARQMGTCDIHPSAKIAQHVFIGESVEIDENVTIHSGCRIMGKAKIKKGTTLYPNTVIYPNVEIGESCIIHANTTIGSDGFGFYFENGKHNKFWHLGGVVIGNSTEIGAGSTIDSGTFSETNIGSNVIIDDQVHIAHNCQVGNGVIMCGQVGLAGSSKVGKFSVMGGKSGMAPDSKIGDFCQVGGGTLINSKNWPDKSILAGYPAIPLKKWLRLIAKLNKFASDK